MVAIFSMKWSNNRVRMKMHDRKCLRNILQRRLKKKKKRNVRKEEYKIKI